MVSEHRDEARDRKARPAIAIRDVDEASELGALDEM